MLGGDRGHRTATGPDAAAAARVRREGADEVAHRLMLEVTALRDAGVSMIQGLAAALAERGVPAPRRGAVWTHTTVFRLMARVGLSSDTVACRSGE